MLKRNTSPLQTGPGIARRTVPGVCLAIAVLIGMLTGPAPAWGAQPWVSGLEQVAVQHEGRIKPLDSFARVHLLIFHERSTLDGDDALAWLIDLMTDPPQAYDRPLFRLRNDDLAAALGLTIQPLRRYSYRQISDAMKPMLTTLHTLHGRPREQRSLVENQIVDLYLRSLRFLELSRSLTCFIPDIRVDEPILAAKLDLEPGTPVSYFHFVNQRQAIRGLIADINTQTDAEPTPTALAMTQLMRQLNDRLKDQKSRVLAIIPPQDDSEKWLSPWELLDGRDLTQRQQQMLRDLNHLVAAVRAANGEGVERHAQAFNNRASMSEGMGFEVLYNKSDLFYRSLYLYLAAFVLLVGSWIVWAKPLRRAGLAMLLGGAVLHTAGVAMRSMIMWHPPVTNLYESVIFVGLIAVLTGLVLEWRRRNGVGILTGSIAGAALHLLGFSYVTDGDTMGMLVAVLDSNFWLTTHVLVITAGYGCTLVAGLIGHVYLFMAITRPRETTRLDDVARNMVGLTLVALFFTTLGTILGGIWADQSWGRFWGWDPKENGAMLIVLWLLVLVHGRITKQFNDIGFAAGLILGNIVVALAWFGVNLLGVGLHSYGFTDSIMTNLCIFCAAELVIALAAGPLAKARQQRAESLL